MAPKRRAEGAGCVFLGKTRRGGRDERRKVKEERNVRECLAEEEEEDERVLMKA